MTPMVRYFGLPDLPAGTYRGQVVLGFVEENRVQAVDVVLKK